VAHHCLSNIIRDYLDQKISLGQGAEELCLSRAELRKLFERLGVPLQLSPASSDPGDERSSC
jgi:hypothetical protein